MKYYICTNTTLFLNGKSSTYSIVSLQDADSDGFVKDLLTSQYRQSIYSKKITRHTQKRTAKFRQQGANILEHSVDQTLRPYMASGSPFGKRPAISKHQQKVGQTMRLRLAGISSKIGKEKPEKDESIHSLFKRDYSNTNKSPLKDVDLFLPHRTQDEFKPAPKPHALNFIRTNRAK